MAADENYPDELKYHREHDWARIEGDTATLGVTWYAQDALGELVHYEPPDVGSSLARDESYETIGGEHEIAPGTIASRISRCLAKLREWFEGRSEAASPSGERVTT